MLTPFDVHGPLHVPDTVLDERGLLPIFVDPERARWIATNRLGAGLLERIRSSPGRSGETLGIEGDAPTRFLRDVARRGFLANTPYPAVVRRNRRESIAPRQLHEFWVVTNDHCNLRCRHCYTIERVKQGRTGLPGDTLRGIIAEAKELGTEVFYFTGGEPTLRDDFLDLAKFVLERAKLVLFTNGHFLDDALATALAKHRDRLVVQISIDGHDETVSRRVRGKGAFDRALAGVETLLEHGIRVGVSTTPNGVNQRGVSELTERLAALERKGQRVDYHHLILLLDRGGAHDHGDIGALTSSDAEGVLERSVRAIARAKETLAGVKLALTNEKIFDALAANGPAKDYCGSGYTILGCSADGQLLPCAACMDDERFFLGDLVEADQSYRKGRLRELWLESPSVERIRRFTLAPAEHDGVRPPVRDLRYFHGGGCWKNMPEPGVDFATGHPFAQFYENQMWAAIRRVAGAGGAPPEDAPRLHRFQHPARIACAGPRKTEILPGGDVDQGHCICFA